MHCIPPAVKYLDVPIVCPLLSISVEKTREETRAIDIEFDQNTTPQMPLKIMFLFGRPISIRAMTTNNDLIWKQIEMTHIKTEKILRSQIKYQVWIIIVTQTI